MSRQLPMQAKPIIPWPGSKRRLASRILPLFPDHECYVEPFCGAAAMLFARPDQAKVEVLNDINGELIRLYRVVQHHLVEFVRQFQWSLTSREMFKWCQMQNIETLTDIQRAARFFYLQQNSFGGKVAGQTFGTASSGKVGMNLCRVEETLSAAHMRLAQVLIEHLPWAECITRYDRDYTLFFIDPPYWRTEGYGVPFPWAEYEALAKIMMQLKGKAILTLNDHPDIRRCFQAFAFDRLPITYTMGNGIHGKGDQKFELVFRSWK